MRFDFFSADEHADEHDEDDRLRYLIIPYFPQSRHAVELSILAIFTGTRVRILAISTVLILLEATSLVCDGEKMRMRGVKRRFASR
jgi:hypothetical protein